MYALHSLIILDDRTTADAPCSLDDRIIEMHPPFQQNVASSLVEGPYYVNGVLPVRILLSSGYRVYI